MNASKAQLNMTYCENPESVGNNSDLNFKPVLEISKFNNQLSV